MGGGARCRERCSEGKEAVQMIKASVLGIDHDDRLDFGEILLCVRGVRARQTDGCPRKRGKRYPHQRKFA
jgi:hypothetical protein